MNQNKKTEIFSTGKGVLAVKGPAKKKILHQLSKGEKTGKQIREELGKAKSTISVHLSDLKELGLINERKCSEDERKKIYSLSADLFGKSRPPSNKHYRKILDNLKESAGNDYEFLKNLFHLIRYGFDNLGINLTPALRSIGKDAGNALAEKFESENLSELLEEIQKFWKRNRLGKTKIKNNHIIVQDCFDCGGMPEIGTKVCSLDEGILEGIIETKTGEKAKVREKECFGTGENHCRFEISLEDR